MRSCRPLIVAILFAGAGPIPAHADIYGFTDGDGGVHYSNVPSDRRYLLLLAEPPEPSTQPPAAAGDWRHSPAAYAGLIDAAAKQAQLPPALLRAVIAVESAFDPHAVSRKGAQGLMQLRPATARRYQVRQPFDPAENLRGGAQYLRDLLKRYDNDMELALAAYNAGADAVDRHGRTIPPFAETRAYVPAVLKWYRKFLGDARFAWYSRTLAPAT